jgi:adenylate kinase family enzyme
MTKNKVVLISGPCASGKSTLGKILASNYGYIHIDGDTVWHKVKQTNKKIHWNEIHDEIMLQSIEFSQSNIVITHLIPPDVFPEYEAFYNERSISFEIMILMPPKDIIMKRNQTRTCWKHPTPEDFIDSFYFVFTDAQNKYGQYFVSNSESTPEETIKRWLLVQEHGCRTKAHS